MQKKGEIVARLLYTHNPFYLISACLVLYGLRSAFVSNAWLPQSAWLLAAALCGYTLLVAATAFLVVRLGKVWQDARSLFLILVLMFFALSVSFDEICNQLPSTAATVLPLGWIFSVLVTEILLRSLRLKFPAGYRLPFYFVLVLFFLFPVWVSPVISELSPQEVARRVFLFPLFCSGALLTLIPAIRRGAGVVQHNGTPWHWPWYPWTLFVFLALAVCLRSYLLTLSFQPAQGMQSSFGLYYLTPLCFAVFILLLEISVVERFERLQRGIIALAPLLLLTAGAWGGGEAYLGFLTQMTVSLGSPLWLATMGLALFYAWALQRAVAWAEAGLAASLLAAAAISPTTASWTLAAEPQWWPLAVLAVWQLERACAFRSSLRWFAAVTSLLLAVAVLGRDRWTDGQAVFLLHAWAAGVLAIGYLLTDHFAVVLRCFAAALTVAAGLVAAAAHPWEDPLRLGYLAALTAVATTIWWATRRHGWLFASIACGCCAAFSCVSWLRGSLAGMVGQHAMVPLSWGVICFVIAMLISALKGGLWREIRRGLRRSRWSGARVDAWI